jgi:hypothetical protein
MMFFEEQDLSCSGRWIMFSKNCALSSLPGKLHLSNGQQVPGILKEKQLGRKTDFASALFLAALRLANQAGKDTGGRIDAARIAELPPTEIPLGLSNFFR